MEIKMRDILQIKMSLEHIKPLIWRCFLVPNTINFQELHNIIQVVIGWENCYLWEFRIGDNIITPQDEEGFNPAESAIDLLTSSPEFRRMIEKADLSKGSASLNINKVNKIFEKLKNEEKRITDIKTPINKLINKEGTKFIYRYDFGDNWKHTLVLERAVDENELHVYITCTAGERACPPEDCGGVSGYYGFMKIRKNKKHPEYKEKIIEWLGEDYNPELFDINEVNNKLKNFVRK